MCLLQDEGDFSHHSFASLRANATEWATAKPSICSFLPDTGKQIPCDRVHRCILHRIITAQTQGSNTAPNDCNVTNRFNRFKLSKAVCRLSLGYNTAIVPDVFKIQDVENLNVRWYIVDCRSKSHLWRVCEDTSYIPQQLHRTYVPATSMHALC